MSITITEYTLSDADLSWAERILIEKIYLYDNDDKGCWASNKILAKFVGVKENSLANMLSSLTARKKITRLYTDGKNRGYRSNLHPLKSQEPSQKNEGYPSQKSETSSEPSQKSEEKNQEPSLFNENEPSQKNEQNIRDKDECLNIKNRSSLITPAHAQGKTQEATAAVAHSPPRQWSELTKSEKKMTRVEFLKHLQKENPTKNVEKIGKRLMRWCNEHNKDFYLQVLKAWVENEGDEFTENDFLQAFENHKLPKSEKELMAMFWEK